MIEDYVQHLLATIAACPLVQTNNLTLDKRAPQAAMIRGELIFIDGSCLYFRELVELQNTVIRRMYSYHYQDRDAALIFRYDDTPHHPHIRTFPHHKHHQKENCVLPAAPPDLSAVIHEIELYASLPFS